ncbi:MAG TPA: XrtA/PEP-CTERM system histidine kinase PrsK [Candidatus Udaeobacter sp.]|nr:XrtA/PEP-CTERM system histidine kinase PrsK [Candidatus Udaeobacter sp.]
MSPNTLLALTAGMFSAALAAVAAVRKQRSLATWCFSAGMMTFAMASLFGAIATDALVPQEAAFWESLSLVAKSFLPGVWLTFSLAYSRANYREFLIRSRWLVIAAFLIPVLSLVSIYRPFFSVVAYNPPLDGWGLRLNEPAKILNVLILVSTVLILTNIERTFRAAVGTMRWRIKFLVLGLGVVFGARIYTQSQAVLFSEYNPSQFNVETIALLMGCALIAVAYVRSGFSEIDVYPSRAVLHTSATVLLTGAYLIIIGVLAQIVARFGGGASFPFAAFVVLLGVVALGVLLLSDRARQSLQLFVSRHFKRPQHDFRRIWARFSQCLSIALDETALGAIASRAISETFGALSVSTWLVDNRGERLVRVSSTSAADPANGDHLTSWITVKELNSTDLIKLSEPFDLGRAKEEWAEQLMERSSRQFRGGGSPICVPLVGGEHWLGAIVLADRVRGLSYSGEEMDLLKCIGDQVAASLLKLRLTEEIMERKELEVFQTMSAFLIHDLKNAASTLGLMLENLPTHFDKPAFREDALRGIGSAAGRINDLINRMNALRHELRLEAVELDLNAVVTDALSNLNGTLDTKLVTKFDQIPKISADRRHLQSVFTNLLLNARDAVGIDGRITVATTRQGEWVALSVSDNGCGMTEQFIKNSLFRPFRSTKKKGLGIGMFQSKTIVEAHHGKIHVESELGVGTTFRVILPLKHQTS